VQDLEALGAEVLILQADVTNAAQMRNVVKHSLDHFGTIHGVLHAAGLPGKGLIYLKTQEMAANVLAPKVQGTITVGQAVEGVPLDFLVLFSSVASISGGGPGQVDYCGANAFLDAYAQCNFRKNGITLSIGWGEWQWNAWDEAMNGYDRRTQEYLRKQREKFGMQFVEGAEAFHQVLSCRLPNVFVSPQDIKSIFEIGQVSMNPLLLRSDSRGKGMQHQSILGNSYVAPRNELEETIAGVWGELLGISEVGINDNFFDLGGNSLVGLTLLSKLRKKLCVKQIPSYVLYEAPSVSAMARFFDGDQTQNRLVDERQDRGTMRRERQIQRKHRS
jgi:hypothetical protein